TLGAAFAATASDKLNIIEIADNGPLFEVPAAVTSRSILLRAAAGYRPLIAWDFGRTSDRTAPFIAVAQGSLALEGLDLVLKWPDEAATEPGRVLRVKDGDRLVRNCTFSASGKVQGGLTLAQLERTKPEEAPCRCRLDHCYVRGTSLQLLDLREPRTEVLI